MYYWYLELTLLCFRVSFKTIDGILLDNDYYLRDVLENRSYFVGTKSSLPIISDYRSKTENIVI